MGEIENLLGVHRYKGATNQPLRHNIALTSKYRELNGYDIVKVVSASELFTAERNESTKLRLHGTINAVSPIVSKKKNYETLLDIFQDGKGSEFTNFYDHFDVFLGYTHSLERIRGDIYQEKVKIISDPIDFEVIPCGFSQNIFNDRVYNFIFNTSYDISTMVTDIDGLSVPVTDIQLYFHPKLSIKRRVFTSAVDKRTELSADTEMVTGDGPSDETVSLIKSKLETVIKPGGLTLAEGVYADTMYERLAVLLTLLDVKLTPENIDLNKEMIREYLQAESPTDYSLADWTVVMEKGTIIDGGVVEFNKEAFTFAYLQEAAYYIKKEVSVPQVLAAIDELDRFGLSYSPNSDGTRLLVPVKYRYNPLQRIKLRSFSSFVEYGDPATTGNIPEYAAAIDDKTMVWRDLLTPGYIEPDSGAGVDHPFLNGAHYLYHHAVLPVVPDFTDTNTFKIYKNYLMTQEILPYSY